ncbi:MBL fold metallo-hydrolase [Paenibacillus sp. FSL R5-0345]|uniref:MBL fold metallo-hydrolase n=1 Tax=Paenibacillus sp. FSL R5-0345 TaxID=1536770 RepID=UPI000694F286|nr:MBL fold metallo-hydrolase [Paenibacillus sp. FSL R5-0345]
MYFIPAGQAVDEQLLSLGYTSKDLDYIILSHLDGDHAGGLQLVKGANNILVSREELEASKGWSRAIRYNSKQWEGINLQPIEFIDSGIGPMKRSFDLFNDGSLQLIWSPGHSKGLISLMVKNEYEDYVLLVADTGYATKSWEKLIIPGISVNKKQAYQSLKWVKKMTRQPNCVAALASHDPDVKPHTITL